MQKGTIIFFFFSLITGFMPTASARENKISSTKIQPTIARQLIEKAKQNTHWKVAFLTGEHEQIVFMNVSPITNPKNEIGMETHTFDQAILIVRGQGNAILAGKTSFISDGDLIFIPEGTPHNVVNLGGETGLKLISFYSDTDIPNASVYKTREDEIKEHAH